MIIKCPECERDVSDKAASCPQCGNPIGTQSKPIQVEQTSKLYKAMLVISFFIGFFGLMGTMGGKSDAVWLMVIGMVGVSISLFGSWWNHG